MQQIDLKKKKPMKKKPLFVKNGAIGLCRVQVNNLICIEKFSDFPQLGRFTLLSEGRKELYFEVQTHWKATLPEGKKVLLSVVDPIGQLWVRM
ncbi:uncharacterized protein LOC125858417 [Solanum stenotomum]|uniref:uncharacterized protein LOC125858417 n=1 Tax=Solanum stenotomum TaxID=172797 RepID=UPI0020D15469|nr:uncharacterized protein LOC125858417 [Solanum stenotomum]XP_049394146.1 uncharacterized protein LOC125858417 [Solanum stenotomum]